MKNIKKICSIICVPVFLIGLIFSISKNNLWNFDSKNYLTSKDDGAVSFYELKDDFRNDNNASFDFSKFNGKFTLMEFSAKMGNKIKLTDSSTLSKGSIYIVVLDSDYNEIAIHKSNGAATFEFDTPKDGNYLIRVAGKKASGSFNLHLNSDEAVTLVHKTIWS